MTKYLLPLLLLPAVAMASPLSDWQSHMTTYAPPVCAFFTGNHSFDEKLNNSYYDGERVMYQICDYTHDPQYCACAQESEKIYRDGYVIPNNGQVPGFYLFVDGLAEDYQRNGDTQSKVAYNMLLNNGSFVQSSPWNDANQPEWSYMRETAYAMRVHLAAPRFSQTINGPRITQLKGFLLGQLDQFFGVKTAPYRKPFMTGLAGEALIDYYEHISQDPAIIPALRQAADYMWANMWVGNSFKYTDDPVPPPVGQGQDPSPDLNLLIAPMYEWLYQKTGVQKYRDQGDLIFNGGVADGYLGQGKQFNQAYRWSFQYVAWRNGGSPTPSPSPGPTLTSTPTRTPTTTPSSTRTPTPSATPSKTPCPQAVNLQGHECRLKRLEGK